MPSELCCLAVRKSPLEMAILHIIKQNHSDDNCMMKHTHPDIMTDLRTPKSPVKSDLYAHRLFSLGARSK
jgi:hypothetical protein